MRLHRSTSEAVIQALDAIFGGKRYADKVIEKVLKQNPKWGARDRRFIAETTYDIVRWYLLLKRITEAKGDDYWKLLAAWCALHGVDLPAWDEFKGVSVSKVKSEEMKARSIRKVRESIPDWLDELGEQELGKLWEKELQSLNEEADVVLRVNTLKISKRDLQERLDEEGVATYDLKEYPDALVLEERQNVFGKPSFKDGLFEVQDAASQLIAPFMKIEPGMRVIDACAGAGGKTLHLAALMKNKGRIVAMDVEQWKLDELQKRARRAGVSNMETRFIESSKTIKRLQNSADRLLLDVPCSGLGVLKRNPDAKWKLSPDFIEKVRTLQQHILNDYCEMLKPGGLMVYSTCSILASENEKQVQQFLKQQEGKFELQAEKRSWPSEGFDGFYMALIKRT
ncbi:RsmB/NOP family class I SAM-dependent RNA methyltransferase [Fulvivirgaceae bacterium PWU4]|uniref:RsmB/NOP family class I SAM-dependent RNA methyltransferase n=1 Tax=Chryseosolibacter histidini TaxID=2782349 RepID=A0AAP2DN60_9BACT|nr:RsmB/NOP family class I SAM-dependent RNA methyltransferase [Chryseosolibacter histidini]MBT1699440.1 RsmB/NOP family class I SAM-dependent RNA methyltransferase [Chryseosolibacter histidini]